jgi:hypothetical protein
MIGWTYSTTKGAHMSEYCQGAKFEILLDGETHSCRDTMLTAIGAAKLIQIQHPNSKVAVRDLETGHLTVLPPT